MSKVVKNFSIFLYLLLPGLALSQPKLPYPEDKVLTADEIAVQQFYGLRGMHLKNFSSQKKGKKLSLLIKRTPGESPSVNAFESFTNYNYQDGRTESKLLIIYRSGKLKGAGILLSTYVDTKRTPDLMIWLPTLRKVRRFSSPSQDDVLNGSILTYGEVFLRRPEHEKHQLLGQQVFGECLNVMTIKKDEQTRRTRHLPTAQCKPKDKAVYQLRSDTLFDNWWYDYRISYIDTSTFAMYRTVYFKDSKRIKTIDIDWNELDHPDPRVLSPNFIYAKSNVTNIESFLVIPKETIDWNTDIKNKFWSERTLKKIKR
jgi:hypothetical protein